ncbi:hypothetical protein ACFL0M_15000 [Thermodesulfobacteriota bacterium]
MLKVAVWRVGAIRVAARPREEHKAGRPAADLVTGSQAPQLMLRAAKLLQPFYSPGLANIEEGLITRAPDGNAFSAADRLHGIGVGFNTELNTMEKLPISFWNYS